jgi:hypothetical protein
MCILKYVTNDYFNYNIIIVKIMTGGVFQLIAKGNEDIYMTYEPQITFFKTIYKRHTNFSVESVPQNFNSKPDFGKKITCTIGKHADLINNMYVCVTLPKVSIIGNTDPTELNKFAWTKNIGWSIIKSVEIEIGGYVIDKHYGDWLHIWSELTAKKNTHRALDNMIGNVPELYEYSTSKDSYTLKIPLYFWFCTNPGSALPIVALEFSDVKINIEFASLNDVMILAPTNYIEVNNCNSHFKFGDILYQLINGQYTYVKYIGFDYSKPNSKKLYYSKISSQSIQSYTDINLKDNYNIYCLNSPYYMSLKQGAIETIHINKQKNFAWTNTVTINKAYLLVDYVFLDVEERIKFIKSNHEYLIDTLMFDSDKNITNNTSKIKLGYSHPCKELIFRAQMDSLVINNLLDKYNYTLDYFKSKNIINKVKIVMNGKDRMSERTQDYFYYLQTFQNHTNVPPKGVLIYSFSLFPEEYQPSGSCNLSKIDDFEINITVDKSVSYNNQAKIRIYGVCLNILRIIDGQGGLAFSN